MTVTSNTESGTRRRTVLSTAGVGALGALAGCTSTLRGDDNEVESDDEDDGEPGGDDPLTDHPYTAPRRSSASRSRVRATLRPLPSRHELVTGEASGSPVELSEVWA